MLKEELHRMEIYEDGTLRFGVLTLKGIPKEGSVVVTKDNHCLKPIGYNPMGNPIFKGDDLDNYSQDELKVIYEPEEIPLKGELNSIGGIRSYIEKKGAKSLAIARKRAAIANGCWLPGEDQLVIWNRYILVPNGEIWVIEADLYPFTEVRCVTPLDLFIKDTKTYYTLSLSSFLRKNKCYRCNKEFSLEQILFWDFELDSIGPYHTSCKL